MRRDGAGSLGALWDAAAAALLRAELAVPSAPACVSAGPGRSRPALQVAAAGALGELEGRLTVPSPYPDEQAGTEPGGRVARHPGGRGWVALGGG